MITTVFFDFSETLVHGTLDVKACRSSVVEFLGSKGYNVSLAGYNLAMEETLRWRRHAKFEGREISFVDSARKTLRILNVNPAPDLISEIEGLEYKHYDWCLLPGVRETLANLARQFRLAIISNSATDSVLRVLKEENLLHFFDAVVLSKDVGFRKPDLRIFNYALDRLGTTAEEALYVGDNFVLDVLGAKKSGMKVIWLTDKPHSWDMDLDGVARDITEVPRIIPELLLERAEEVVDSNSAPNTRLTRSVTCLLQYG